MYHVIGSDREFSSTNRQAAVLAAERIARETGRSCGVYRRGTMVGYALPGQKCRIDPEPVALMEDAK